MVIVDVQYIEPSGMNQSSFYLALIRLGMLDTEALPCAYNHTNQPQTPDHVHPKLTVQCS